MTDTGGRCTRRAQIPLIAGALATVIASVMAMPGVAGAAGSCLTLPAAFSYGEYTGGSTSLSGGTVLGSAAYGGSLVVDSSSTLASAAGPTPSADTLVVGAGVDVAVGTLTLDNGSAIAGGSVTGTLTTPGGGTVTQDSTSLPVAFPTATPALTSFSGTLGSMAATGTPTGSTTVTFAGTGSGTSVFSIAESTLASATTLDVGDSAGGTVLINVTGSSALTLSGVTVNLSGISDTNVIWNFPKALTLKTSTWHGSVVDPGSVTLTGNTVTGSVLASGAGAFTNNTVNQGLFVGCISSGPGTSTPETPITLLLPLSAIAVGGGFIVMRRRRQNTGV